MISLDDAITPAYVNCSSISSFSEDFNIMKSNILNSVASVYVSCLFIVLSFPAVKGYLDSSF